MDCPRCGGAVTVYQLGDRESYVCDDCEYVGIDVEHGAEPEEIESWDEAMERFYERFSGVSTGAEAADDETSDEDEVGNRESSAVEHEPDAEAVDGESAPGDGEADGSEPGASDDSDNDGAGDGRADDGELDDDDGADDGGIDDELTPAIVRADSDASSS
jgi:hypothetical protein